MFKDLIQSVLNENKAPKRDLELQLHTNRSLISGRFLTNI